jgi:O-antigen/teichoic acid export membrane protein
VAIALSWWAPLWLHLPTPLVTPLRWATAIASLGIIAIAFSVVFRSVLETVQRGYWVRGALLLQSLTITGLSLWWVWIGWGIVGMAAANVCGLMVGAGLWIWWARRWVPRWGETAAAELKAHTLWTYNWPLLLAMLGNQINQMTDNTVVGMRLGAEAVAAFALTQSLPLLASAQLTEIGAVSWAALGELRERDAQAFGERVVELASTVLGVGAVLMITLGSFNRAFVGLWVGTQHYDGALLTWATVASVVVFSWLCFFGWLIDTQGDSRKRVTASSIGSAINLGLSLLLVSRLGVAGVALGTLVAYLCTDAWFLPGIAIRHYQVPAGALLRAVGTALLRAVVWAGLWLTAALYIAPAANWGSLILELAAAGCLAAAYCWRWMLRPADRQAWRQRWTGLWAQ